MKNIKFESVESSNILSIGYDETESVLYVNYKTGIYRYDGVDKSTYESLMSSDSKGRFMNENIKGQFNYSKMV
jgi:hypothetical protein